MVWQVFGTKTSPAAMSTLDTQSQNLAQWGQVDCTAAGTNVITLTPSLSGYTGPAYANYVSYRFVAANTTTGVATLKVGALAALKVYAGNGTSQLAAGDIVSGQFYVVSYNSALDSLAGGWVVQNASGWVTISRLVLSGDRTFATAILPKLLATGNISGTVTVADPIAYFQLAADGDTVDADAVSGFNYFAGGGTLSAGAKGNRSGVYGSLVVVGPTGNVAAVPRYYVAVAGKAYSNTNDNGTAPTPSGNLVGGTFQAYFGASATFWNSLVGTEIDVIAPAGSSVAYKAGLQIISDVDDAVQGSTSDFGLGFGKTSTSVGFKMLVAMCGAAANWPLSSGGTLIGTEAAVGGSMNALYGIDFSAITFTGSGNGAFKSTGILIDGSGNTVFTAAAVGPTLKQGANGRVGTFAANGATPVTVNNTSVAITDTIIISLNTVGGTVGALPAIKTITAATGFTVAGTASDTSTYNYAIIKNAA